MMKRLFILSFLWCFSFRVQAQDIPKELLKTWLPILSQDFEGDTIYQEDLYFITFEQEGGHFELPNQEFTFSLSQDSLKITIENGEVFTLRILELQNDRLVLLYDSNLIITYIPLPNYDQRIDLSVIESSISNNIWVFNLPRFKQSLINFKVEFYSMLQDSSLVNYQYINTVKTAKLYPPNIDNRMLWYVDKHQNTTVIHIEQILGSFFSIEKLIIKNFEKEKMNLVFWSSGLELNIEARKLKKKSAQKQRKEVDLLTRQAWRIEKEIILKSKHSDLEAVVNQSFIEFEGLPDEIDSTVFVTQKDIDSNSLILKFDEVGTYEIYRESRLLDQGEWSFQFNNTIVNLKSYKNQEDGNGIVGGYIEILRVKKNMLTLKRVLENKLSFQINQDESLWEIYKPVR
ncbi:MAG: hypothetical protein COW03_14380 [Cytophagales bacterium CG12_big_fil_rev_8_21_14_0_65_40_12]|nr:MAG: hypothetical protein COW03_14380 [Cytophagales bacterium CG12_big_fil_rev_8_21_14_0_65_40_12]PIW04116.1 MAG: hypothetical protein COW40_11565 [Cytophagales bacterium CG17_big_fil_post_rev_8_21_14_2_50_40_13]